MMLQLAEWGIVMTVSVNLAEMSEYFCKILLTFLQQRNQFCPIKQMAKESLVYLLCVQQPEYFIIVNSSTPPPPSPQLTHLYSTKEVSDDLLFYFVLHGNEGSGVCGRRI